MALQLCRNAPALQPDNSARCDRSSRRRTRHEVSCKTRTGQAASGVGYAIQPAHSRKVCGLYVDSFEHFALLLEACQDYARLTGCRFHGLSYEAQSLEPLRGSLSEGDFILSTSGATSLDRLGPMLLAELNAAPLVRQFAERLQSGDPELLSDLSRAFETMMAEGVRNSLRVTCQQLGLWPPIPTPRGVEASDCFYFDAQAHVPVVAQRLFNDEKRRAQVSTSTEGVSLEQVLAATASFLLDFACEAGVTLPSMPPRYETFLKDFAANVRTWEDAGRKDAMQIPQGQHATQWEATDLAEAVDLVRLDIKNWLNRTLHLPTISASL